MSDTQFDIVIFGATSFVGDILTAYMMMQYGVNSDIKWAIAGRSETNIKALKEKHHAQEIPHIIADATNTAHIENMVKQTRVMVSTVGPYALYGEPLVKACAENGTDYCDLTGEMQWYKRMMDRYEACAKKSGARLVMCSGFDSLPSDLGVYFLQQAAKKQFGKMCHQVKMRVVNLKGGLSGGTIASIINIAKEAVKDAALRKELQDHYSICPAGHGYQRRQNNVAGAQFDEHFKCWIGPFIMAAVNTRVVHRSNALLNNAYGKDFKYDEAMLMGKGKKGKKRARYMGWSLNAFTVLAAIAPTRWLLEKFMLPKPGTGPSPSEQESGHYEMRFIGLLEGKQVIAAKVTGDRDPGYGSTAKMLGEAAVCLAGIKKEDKNGGFWTPASIYGEDLIERLCQHSGLAFETLEIKSKNK